jgi:hypothetical protein
MPVQIALGAAATLSLLPRLVSDIPGLLLKISEQTRARLRELGLSAAAAALVLTLLLSASRTTAVLMYYRAPMQAWRHVAHLPPHNGTSQHRRVCVAGEWYRFASSFFLPPSSELAFLDSSFDGAALPHASHTASSDNSTGVACRHTWGAPAPHASCTLSQHGALLLCRAAASSIQQGCRRHTSCTHCLERPQCEEP